MVAGGARVVDLGEGAIDVEVDLRPVIEEQVNAAQAVLEVAGR